MDKEKIIAELKKRFVTREELRELLNAESDTAARHWLKENVKKSYPVICTSSRIGYKIATSAEDLELAKECSRENHRKAATLHRNTNVLDAWIITEECHGAITGTIPFKEEIRQIISNN